MYPPSPSMRGPPRNDSPERGRDGTGPGSFGRPAGPPHYPYQPGWMGGAYGHPAMGPAAPAHGYHLPPGPQPGPEGINKQPGPVAGQSPAYAQPQHFAMGQGPYPPHHPQHGPPTAYGGPQPHVYGYGGQPRPPTWGYGNTPAGFDQQPQRYGFPPTHAQQGAHTMQMGSHNSQLQAPSSSNSSLLKNQRSQPGAQRPTGAGPSIPSETQQPAKADTAQKVTSTSAAKPDDTTKSSSLPGRPIQESVGAAPEGIESEKVKLTMSTELTLAEVKPIQSDFHFFVHDMKPKFQALAESEVNRIMANQKSQIEKNSPKYHYLVNSNLNCRLLRAWEVLSMDERSEYMKKEEDDRRRFMDEDEVASRHCFTLTARVRSPSKNKPSSPRVGENDPADQYDENDDLVDNDNEDRDEDTNKFSDNNGGPIIVKSHSRTNSTTSITKSDRPRTVSPKTGRASASKITEASHSPAFKAENVVTPPNKKDETEKSDGVDEGIQSVASVAHNDHMTPKKLEDDNSSKKVVKRSPNSIAPHRDESPPKRNRF